MIAKHVFISQILGGLLCVSVTPSSHRGSLQENWFPEPHPLFKGNVPAWEGVAGGSTAGAGSLFHGGPVRGF